MRWPSTGATSGVARAWRPSLPAAAPKIDPLDASQHLITNHEIAVAGDTAECRCYFQAQHVRHAMEDGPHFIVAGTYVDRLSRGPEGWRIDHRTLSVLWAEGNPAVLA